ncbi:MAG: M6 family metalloprotease domain-containing protein, partial [Paludibacteraceae bacterium]|nr:M6 family metalloprotease domain-containing protein [Paludibacteraceae bacterium]
MMRKRYFLFLLVLFFELLAFALPAKKGVINVNQPDGTQLRIEGHGDENFHYITTEDGFLVKKNNDGIYEYAEFAEQRIKPLGIKARSIGERIDAEKMFLKRTQKSAITISHEQETSMRKIAAQQIQDLRPQKVIGQRNYPQRGLVILVNFQDVAFSPQNTLAEMDSMLNGVNYTYEGATASARKYFFDQSSGAYNPTFDVVGPVTLSNNVAFYGGNDASGNDIRPDSMVIEACRLADEQLGVDFSRYDNEGDGVIDFVFIVYAGYGEASNYSDSPDLIWQHAWYIYQGAGKIWFFDGKLLNIYACSSELSGTVGSNRRDGIGAFCHEFSHVLGLPDTYATNGASHFTLGAWNIMDQGPYNNNGKTPPSYSAYERFFMGWLTPTYLSRTQNVTIGELQSTNEAYLFCEDGTHNLDGETPNPELFYMFENRQKVGWDAYLPGHGLLVTKINYNSSSWTRNAVNNNSAAMGIDILEADG